MCHIENTATADCCNCVPGQSWVCILPEQALDAAAITIHGHVHVLTAERCTRNQTISACMYRQLWFSWTQRPIVVYRDSNECQMLQVCDSNRSRLSTPQSQPPFLRAAPIVMHHRKSIFSFSSGLRQPLVLQAVLYSINPISPC